MSGTHKRKRRDWYVYDKYLPRIISLIGMLYKLNIKSADPGHKDSLLTGMFFKSLAAKRQWDKYCIRYYEKRRKAQSL